MDREDSFNTQVCSSNCGDILGDWGEVGEPCEAIQHN